MLEYWYSKCGLQTSDNSQDSFRGPQGQKSFYNNSNVIFLFHCVDIYTDGTEVMVGKTAAALAHIMAVAPNCTS